MISVLILAEREEQDLPGCLESERAKVPHCDWSRSKIRNRVHGAVKSEQDKSRPERICASSKEEISQRIFDGFAA
jgi:hypothetical protein